jgi:putative ABC transport system permease protein
MAGGRKLYRFLLKLYPARFREEYAAPLEQQFCDEYAETRSRRQRILFWVRAVRDLASAIPREGIRELGQDLRFATRVYRQRSLVTILALTALALSIGATTGVFSVLNALLIRSLPFREPERLVQVQMPPVNPISGRSAFYRWRDANSYLEDTATYSTAAMTLGLEQNALRVGVAETSANFFSLLGTEPILGRAFVPDEDLAGRDGVAVIGYGLWQEQFGGDPRVLGKTIPVNGTPMMVIGVAPPTFDFPGKTAVWTPTVFDFRKLSKTGVGFWETVGRLKPGLALAGARSRFEADVAQRHPESLKRAAKGPYVAMLPMLIPLREQLAGKVRQASWVLMGVVIFVLLIACANVGHLLLSRLTERRQELAIRAALGASRARLVQQLITESLLLTFLAAASGLGVAYWASRLVGSVQPAQLAAQNYTILDWRVLAFAVGLAALTGILFGVLPASLMGRMQPSADPLRLPAGGRASGANRLRIVLIALQAGLTLVLVAGSVLMGRTFLRLMETDLGFQTDHVATLNVSLAGTRYEANRIEREYYRQALDRLRAVPGVESAGAVSYLPLIDNIYGAMRYSLDPAREGPAAVINWATPDYFRTMKTGLVKGREFTAADRAGSERVMIVNDTFARELGVEHVVGKRLWDYRGKVQTTVVGVVRTERLRGPADPGRAQVYFPMEQFPPDFVTFVVRVRGNPRAYLAVCRDALRQVDPQIPVYDVKTLQQRLADNTARPRFYTTAILFFGGFALLLALIGIYGVTAYSIGQRTHEIGVRLAVGAAYGDVRLLLLRQTFLPALAGMVSGTAGALALGRSLQHLISSAPRVDVWSCVWASLVLLAAAAVAAWLATRRILEMDPTNALRAE